MKTIPLGSRKYLGLFALVDDEDYELLSKYNWYAHKSKNTFYAHRKVKLPSGKWAHSPMHREILGLTDPKIQTDHRDHNGLHNWRNNLRVCTKKENAYNQRKHGNNTSGYKGVTFHKRIKKWQVRIKINYKYIHLGYFHSIDEAAHTYNAAAIQHFGEFAHINSIPTLPCT